MILGVQLGLRERGERAGDGVGYGAAISGGGCGGGSGGWLGRWWQSGESMKEGKVNSGEEEG